MNKSRNVLSEKAYTEELLKPFVAEEFVMDLQLFGKGGKSGGKILLSVLGFAVGFCNPAMFGITAAHGVSIAAGVMGAALGGSIWTATHSNGDLGGTDTPSIQRFDKVQESMSSTSSIPVVYGTRKISGNQTFHETNSEQNILHKHVVLCEGGISGIRSVCANDLLIPTDGQTSNTVFTLTNTVYEDAKAWKDGKTLHLFCNGKDRTIYLCNKDDAERADTYYAWQTSIDSLVSYINRLGDGWQAFPVATTTRYPGDLSLGSGGLVSKGIKTLTYAELYNDYIKHRTQYALDDTKKNHKGSFKYNSPSEASSYAVGETILINDDCKMVVKEKKNGKYQVEVFGTRTDTMSCYGSTVNATASTVTGGTNYVFHDCEPPSNYETVGGYPNMAWIDLTLKTSEELSGNPSIDCIVDGMKVYDPRTKQTVFSDNPALCVRDFLLSKRYGLGRWIDADDLDDDSFIEAANYCDQQVTVYDADNNPLKSKRYTLNMVIDQRQDAIKWLQDMLGNFAAWLVISKDKIKLLVEKPSPVCYKFNDDNIKDLKVVPLKASEVPNHYQVTITDSATNWKNVSLVVDNFADQKARGKVISKEVELSGVTSQPQALRLAQYYSEYNLSCPITLSFTTGIEAMALECGDIITVSYRDAFKGMPIRISTIRETSENEFEIYGRQYNEGIYSDNLGNGIQIKNYTVAHEPDEDSDYFFMGHVKDLNAQTVARKNMDGKTEYDISVTYELPANYYIDSAVVYYQSNATNAVSNNKVFAENVPANQLGYYSDWQCAGESTTQVKIPNVHIGDTYKIRVATKTRKGKIAKIANAPEVTCKVTPKSTVPSKPFNIRYDFSKEFRFMWEDVADSDVVYYEIRTNKKVGETDGLLGRTTAPTIAVKLTNRKGKVFVYAVNSHKKASYPASVEYNYPKPVAPSQVTITELPRGVRIVVPAFPVSCNAMNLYVTGTRVSDKFVSKNPVYSFNGAPDIYTLRVAYVDLLGEGYTSQEYTFTVDPTFPEEWIKDGSIGIKKTDAALKEIIDSAQTNIPAIKDDIKEINTDIKGINFDIEGINTDIKGINTDIEEINTGILNIQGDVTNITKKDGLIETTVKQYDKKARADFASQIKQTEKSITATVAANKKEQDGKNTQFASQINLLPSQITSTVEQKFGVTWDKDLVNPDGTKGGYKGGIVQKISEIQQTTESIQSTVKTNKDIQDGKNIELASQITQECGKITSTVQETLYGKGGTKENPKGGIVTDISQAEQTAKGFTTRVKGEIEKKLNSEDIKNNYKIVTTLASQITQSKDAIDLKVQEELYGKGGNSKTPTGGLAKSISDVKLTAENIKLTVSGNYDEKTKTGTKGLVDRVSSLELTDSSIKATIAERLDGKKDPQTGKRSGGLVDKITQMEQTAEGFTTTAIKKVTDKLNSKDTTNNYAVIKELAGQITTSASEINATVQEKLYGKGGTAKDPKDGSILKSINNVKMTADGTSSTVSTLTGDLNKDWSKMTDKDKEEYKKKYKIISQVSQKADEVSSTVQGIKNNLNNKDSCPYTAISSIKQKANEITTKVQGLDTAVNGQRNKDGSYKKDKDGKVIQPSLTSQIQQRANEISTIITNLKADPSKILAKDKNGKSTYPYSAIVQMQDSINLRVKSSDYNGKKIVEHINQIEITGKGTTIDGKYLHITGKTLFDSDVISSGMIKASAIKGTHIAAGAITADKIAASTLSLTGKQGIKGGSVLLNASGMKVTNDNGSYVMHDGNGMGFYDKTGNRFAMVGRFMTGTASDGQTVTFTKPWDVVPNVTLIPVTIQTGVAGYDKVNLTTKCFASNVTSAGFTVNCYTTLGTGSGGTSALNKTVSGNGTYTIPVLSNTQKATIGFTLSATAKSVYHRNVNAFRSASGQWNISISRGATDYVATMKIQWKIGNKVVATDTLTCPAASHSGFSDPYTDDEIKSSYTQLGSTSHITSGTIKTNTNSTSKAFSRTFTYPKGTTAIVAVCSVSTNGGTSGKAVFNNAGMSTTTETRISRGKVAFIVTDQSNQLYTAK